MVQVDHVLLSISQRSNVQRPIAVVFVDRLPEHESIVKRLEAGRTVVGSVHLADSRRFGMGLVWVIRLVLVV